MLFSATFKKKIERLARDVLGDPVKIVQGSVGEASEDVHQIVKVMDAGGFKWQWLLGMVSQKILIIPFFGHKNSKHSSQHLIFFIKKFQRSPMLYLESNC